MATLTNFGVPVDGTTSTLLMPKLQYRFRVTLVNFGETDATTTLSGQVVSVTRPNLTHEEVTLDVYNSKVYIAGKHTWDPVTLTVRDDITNSVSKAIADQLNKQLNHADQDASRAAENYKFGAIIEVLDGSNEGEALDAWSLNGCFIQNVQYGELNYATSDAVQITMQIRFDNADHHDTGTTDPADTGLLSEDGNRGSADTATIAA